MSSEFIRLLACSKKGSKLKKEMGPNIIFNSSDIVNPANCKPCGMHVSCNYLILNIVKVKIYWSLECKLIIK